MSTRDPSEETQPSTDTALTTTILPLLSKFGPQVLFFDTFTHIHQLAIYAVISILFWDTTIFTGEVLRPLFGASTSVGALKWMLLCDRALGLVFPQ